MDKHPPKKYAPGELQRTRENLGQIPEDEAKRVGRLLGGEIGIEKTDDEIDKKYQELRKRSLSSRKYTKSPRTKSGSDRQHIAQTENVSIEESSERRQIPYIERIKMDFLSVQPEHMVKRKGEAVASLFSFLFHVPDTVHPRFIKDGDFIFYKHIECLVISIRNLLAINNKSKPRRIKPSFELDILTVLRDWDIATIHLELSRLQKQPRKVPVASCELLLREIFKPVMKLWQVDPYNHIERAIRALYEADILTVPKNSKAEKNIQNYYITAKEEIPYLFQDIPFRCYPLLMKCTSIKFREYKTYFIFEMENILRFLGLTYGDLLVPKSADAEKDEVDAIDSMEDETLDRTGPDPDSETSVEKKEEGKETETEVTQDEPTFPEHVTCGISFLSMLFPNSGLDRIDEFPDVYAYFQPLFTYPKGTELISPDDPLLQIVVLVSIVQEFFYGFRSIEFGMLYQSEGKGLDLQQKIDQYTEKWPVFIDEILSKQYGSRLYDYCRQVERGFQFKTSQYGEKVACDLKWIKRMYFLPYLHFHAVKGSKPTLSSYYPKLFELTRELTEILHAIVTVIDDPEARTETVIKNAKASYRFEIENPVSRRLKFVIKQNLPVGFANADVATNSNASFILYTEVVLSVLNYLINNPESPFYTKEEYLLYRSEENKGDIPLYSVPLLDTFALLREAEHIQLGIERDDKSSSEHDGDTNLYPHSSFHTSIRKQIDDYHTLKKSFSIVAVEVIGITEYTLDRGMEAGKEVFRHVSCALIRAAEPFSGLGFYGENDELLILLPSTEKKNAFSYAITIAAELRQEIELPLAIGVVEFHRTWGPEKMEKISYKTVETAREHEQTTVALYDPFQSDAVCLDPFTKKRRYKDTGTG